jgi:hypothetical protein
MRLAALALVALVTLGCAGKPFDVKRIRPVAPESLPGAAHLGPVNVRAAAVWDEEWALENFDANVILAGVLPVRVDLENTAASPAEVRKWKFELASATGGRFKRLDAKKAMKKIEGYYGITLRSKSGDALYKEDFRANELAIDTPLGAGERRQGLVFFEIPAGVDEPVVTTLTVRDREGESSLSLAPSRRVAGE